MPKENKTATLGLFSNMDWIFCKGMYDIVAFNKPLTILLCAAVFCYEYVLEHI